MKYRNRNEKPGEPSTLKTGRFEYYFCNLTLKNMHVSVHFSKIRGLITENINKAKKEIRIAVAWLTDEDLIRALALRQADGVAVKVVISDSMENFKDIDNLGSIVTEGGSLFVCTKIFLHHKFCIIDDCLIIMVPIIGRIRHDQMRKM